MNNVLFKLVLLAALSIVISCSDPNSANIVEDDKCDNSPSYWTGWDAAPRFISIADDSLAIFLNYKYKIEYKKEYIFLEGDKCVEKVTKSHTGLSLVNYRVKQKPLLIDTLDYGLEVVGRYFRDSSVLVRSNNKFGFWKIGTNSVKLKEFNISEDSYLYNANPWINENILFNNDVVLNTKTRQVETLDFSGENEFLSNCYAKSYIGNKIVCIRSADDVTDYYELVVDGIVTDTNSLWDGVSYWTLRGSISLHGNYVIGREYEKPYEGGVFRYVSQIYKINTESFKFDDTFTPVWINGGPTFYRNNDPDDFIQYSRQDFAEIE